MNWEDVSEEARRIMDELGNFSPTALVFDCEVKGWIYDEETASRCKTYWTATNLRHIAAACNEVADWLDNRATEAAKESPWRQWMSPDASKKEDA